MQELLGTGVNFCKLEVSFPIQHERIMESKKAQYDIVYIKNTKKLRSGMVTDEFADDLILASDNVFCKKRRMPFHLKN